MTAITHPPSDFDRVLARVGIVLVVWSIAATWLGQVGIAFTLGDSPSELADAYSEANAIRAGESYAVRGFGRDVALPNVGYGDRFANLGMKADRALCPKADTCVYTHYPPGPDLMVGLMTKLFGVGRIALFRLAPLTIGLTSLIVFAIGLVRAFGPFRAGLALYAFQTLPMFGNMMHGLHMQGYTFSLLRAQEGILLAGFASGGSARRGGSPAPALSSGEVPLSGALSRRWLAAIGGIAFLQGWLSFDVCFLVTFSAVALWLLRPDWHAPLQRHRVVAAVLVAGSAYTLAVVLHFVQDAVYYGGVSAAIADLRAAAAYRSTGSLGRGFPYIPLLSVWILYLTRFPLEFKYFEFNYIAVLTFLWALLAQRCRVMVPSAYVDLAFHSPRHRFAAALVAFGLSLVWISLMRNHGLEHGHFLPRHLFLSFEVAVLALLASVTATRREAPSPVIDARVA